MSFEFKKNRSSLLLATIVLLLGVYALPAFGEEEKTIEQYISEAAPYLHHSCESAWVASGQDADEYVAMINRFVAIVFINHDFDIQRIAGPVRQCLPEQPPVIYPASRFIWRLAASRVF